MSDVIEFAPHLALKRAGECRHDHCEVDEDAAELSCTDCGAALDPWWYLRHLASDDVVWRKTRQDQQAEYERWLEHSNATIARLTREIVELTETKNRLWNEQVNGRPLGALVRRRRRPA